MPETLRSYLNFTVETAYLAGKLTLGYFQAGVRPDFKGDNSPVTIADRKAEELIRSRIEKKFPRHAIVGEEYGIKESEGAGHRWIIDPIDGTKSFLHGVPLYAVLIGLEIDGTVEVGAAYFPALDEMLAAAAGQGCWWNGRPARVSETSRLHEALIVFTDPDTFAKRGRRAPWERLKNAANGARGWSDAYGYLLVATGRAEIALDPAMEVWDNAPYPPIFREAGGYFGDWQGNPTIYRGEALATTPALLPEVLALLSTTPIEDLKGFQNL